MEVNSIAVNVQDQTGQILELHLTPEQYERLQRADDQSYLQQLIQQFKFHANEAIFEPELPKQEEDDNNIDPVDNEEKKYFWTEPCVYLLLSLYEENKENFETSRHIKVYKKITDHMKLVNQKYDVTPSQVQTKINGLKKQYKKIIDHNNKSGNDRQTWPYFDRMQELFGNSAWAHPVATASEAGPSQEGEPNHETNQQEPKAKKRKLDRHMYLEQKLKIQKESVEKLSEQRERHHNQKMQLLQSILNNNGGNP